MSGKFIVASVGLGGVNIHGDSGTIQYLLNCVPETHGGPQQELVIDGMVGPLTIKAISRFQFTQFGWADSRVDPEASGGITIVELKKFDPFPLSPPIVLPSINSASPPRLPGKGVLRGKKHSGGPGRPATPGELIPPVFSQLPRGKGFGKKVTIPL